MTSNPTARADAPLVRIEDLKVHFPTSQARNAPVVRAVDGVSFDVPRNTIVGLVGESGSGKTTTGRALLRLFAPTAGRIVFDGQDITTLNEKQMLPWRRRMQIVFQDPYASLNPRLRVDEIVGEAARIHGLVGNGDFDDYVSAQLERAGLDPALRQRYPHQFSGGQRQRIGIARALVLRPALVICDEPVSALDVSVQAQILNLLVDLKDEFRLSYLFISHDLSVVHYLADRVLVMNAGRIVEEGPNATLWREARHPYTRSLIDALPRGLDTRDEDQRRIA